VPAQQLDRNLRQFPTRFTTYRQDGANNFDYSVIKDTSITESVKAQIRIEFFNGLNHPAFDPPQLSPTAANFGVITRQSNVARRLQTGLRLVW